MDIRGLITILENIERDSSTSPLNEVFDAPSPYTIISDSPRSKDWSFHSSELNLTLDLYVAAVNLLMIEFTVNNTMATTGRGNAFKVFATVVKILEDQLNRFITTSDHDIRMVGFTALAMDRGRVKLFDRLAPRVSAMLGSDWEFSRIDNSMTFYYIWKKVGKKQ